MNEPTKQQRYGAIVEAAIGPRGKMISSTKTAPKGHQVFFNGNIFDQDGQVLWYGDVDVTKDLEKLKQVAYMIRESIYVTAESPFRWGVNSKKSLEEACQEKTYLKAMRVDP